MKVLWFTWKDRTNPLAGGAETVADELCSRMALAGHEVIMLTAGYPGAAAESVRNGYKIVRVGSRWTVYWKAFRYYRAHLRGWASMIIEEMNTIPFFTQWYVREPRILLCYQLAREIWFYQMGFPLSLIGWLLEPVYLFFLRNNKVITESESTRDDLCRYGFKAKNITIMTLSIELEPVESLSKVVKEERPTLLSLGAIRPMKRTLDQVRAFERAKADLPSLQMKIAGGGGGAYYDKVMEAISASPYKADIAYLGRVSQEEKLALMRSSHLIAVTSLKEGWGLIVSEANSQGTPAVAYDVDGLRDSTRDGVTGIVTKPNPAALAAGMVRLLTDTKRYASMQKEGWEWSKTMKLEGTYRQFLAATGIVDGKL